MLKIFASTVATLDSNVHTGGGTDVTEALQAVLDRAPEENGIHLVMDGAALIHGLRLYSNTTIECIGRESGFYMADDSNRPMFTNAHWDARQIRDRNITFLGGTYNHNCTHQRHSVSTDIVPYPLPREELMPDFQENHLVYLLEFYGVEDFVIQDVTFRNQRTYTLTLCNFKNARIENSVIEMADHVHPSNQDGFHFFGPGRFLTMRNIRGCTGDDFINLAADELDGVSSITDVLIDGVVLDDCCQGIRMLSLKEGLLDRVTIRNVTGTYRTFAFSIIPFWPGNDFGHFGDIFLENIDLRQMEATYHYTPLTFLQTGGNIESMTLKNIRIHSPVRNNTVLEIGLPFFYIPKEITKEEKQLYGIDDDPQMKAGWMPEKIRPRIGSFEVDGLRIESDEKTDGMNIIELHHRIDNCVIQNVQVFRTNEASMNGCLVKLADETMIKNLIVEDVFAEKLNSVICAKQEHVIDCVRIDNVFLRDGVDVVDIDEAQVNASFITHIKKV